MLSEATTRAYLERLGIDGTPAVTVEGLRLLHRAHLMRVPFENLSIHLGEPIVLEVDALVAKLVERRRGGFCYELNGAFAALLRSLGFNVTLLAARVFAGEGRLGRPFDHMCLQVDLAEPWLADVGFGDSFLEPLRLDERGDQTDPAGVFRLSPAEDGQVDLLRDGEPQYRFALTACALGDYEATCRYHQTSPESHFTQRTVCSIATPDGRVTISGSTLITTVTGERTERDMNTQELAEAYREHFGMQVDPTALA